MSESFLVEAGPNDIDVIVGFLSKMQAELKEFDWDESVARESVTRSFDERVHWFLFKDEQGRFFGTCHLQSIHNYWRLKKRYYLGAFFIAKEHRGAGRLRDLYGQLKVWSKEHNGTALLSFIHDDNERSIKAFRSVGLKPIEYRNYIDLWKE